MRNTRSPVGSASCLCFVVVNVLACGSSRQRRVGQVQVTLVQVNWCWMRSSEFRGELKSLHMQPPNIRQTGATFEGFGCKKKKNEKQFKCWSFLNKGWTADLCLSKGERRFTSKPLLFIPLLTKIRLKVWANLAWFWHCFLPAGRQTQQANKKTCFDVPF